MSHSILHDSDSSDCVFTKTLLLSAVAVFLLAEKLRSASVFKSVFPYGNAKQAFTTLAKVQYFRLPTAFLRLSTWRHTSSVAGCALRESHFHSGAVVSRGVYPPLTPCSKFPPPPLHLLPPLPLEVGPLIAARGSGGAL